MDKNLSNESTSPIYEVKEYIQYVKNAPPRKIKCLYHNGVIIKFIGQAVVMAHVSAPGGKAMSVPQPIEFPIECNPMTLENAFKVYDEQLRQFINKQNNKIVTPKPGIIVGG